MKVFDHIVKGLRPGLVVLAGAPAVQQFIGGSIKWTDSALLAAVVTAVEACVSAYSARKPAA